MDKINRANYETRNGEKILCEKIKNLKDKIAKNIEDIAYAKSFDDLSENSEYCETKKLQRKYSDELQQLTEYMKNLHVVDKSECDETLVSLGATVHILDCDSSQEKVYKIVGFYESNVSEGLIFYNSPLGRVLLGRKIYDEFEFKPNSGKEFYYSIIRITCEEE